MKTQLSFTQNLGQCQKNNTGLKRSSILTISFFYVIFIYPILLHINEPSSINYVLYGFSIIICLHLLVRGGLNRIGNKYDALSLFLFVGYYIVSLLFYLGLSNSLTSYSWALRDIIYSIIPPVSYLIIRLSTLPIRKETILTIILYSIIIYDVISLLLMFAPSSFFSSIINQDYAEELAQFALKGYLGVIITGFLNTIGLCISIFNPVKIGKIQNFLYVILFIICGFLSGQRVPIGCFLIIVFIVLFSAKKKINVILGLAFTLITVSVFFDKTEIEVDGVLLKETLINRNVTRINKAFQGDNGRLEQQQILNSDCFLKILFGDGVGRHSPENIQAEIAMPDAMLFRIFNEMGIIGTMLFVSFFYFNLKRALKDHNHFMIAFILCCFFSNFFNRVLFYAPISIIPYVIIATCNWKYKTDNYEENISSGLF